MDKGVKLAVTSAGGVSALADALGIRPQAVHQWVLIPPTRAIQIEKIFNIPRARLRPDLFR